MIDIDRLEQLRRLRESGALNEEEFAREKAAILGSKSVPVEDDRWQRLPLPLAIAAVVGLALCLYVWVVPTMPPAGPSPQPAHPAVVAAPPTFLPESAPPLPTKQVDASATLEAKVGRCHMGECSWSRELKRATIGAGPSGTLIRLKLLGGSSDDHGSPVTWDTASHDVYVLCSLRLPSVMIAVEGGWQVDVLDFVDGVPGVLESAASLYGDTCHSGDENFLNNAAALGYSHIPDEREEVTISKPQEIFTRADF